MLHLVQSTDDPYVSYLRDDPVRPHIPLDQRLGQGRYIFVLSEADQPSAIVCATVSDHVPVSEQDLFTQGQQVCVFYTIWSYNSGSGRRLILEAVEYVRQNLPLVQEFVTLSPRTDLARRFHTRNGAVVYRENPDTVNYQYLV